MDINATGVNLQGQGPGNSQIEYVGSAAVSDIVSFNNSELNRMDGFFIFGGPISGSNVPHPAGVAGVALLINETHKSEFSHISTWGATTGIMTKGAVTDTFTMPHISVDDATSLIADYGASGVNSHSEQWDAALARPKGPDD